MKNSYFFTSVIVIIILVLSLLLGSSVNAQNKTKKVVKVKTHVDSDSDDSTKVIVNTIVVTYDSDLNSEESDSITKTITVHMDGSHSSNKNIKIIEIVDGDTVITNISGEEMSNVWIKEFDEAKHEEMSAEIEKVIMIMDDSLVHINYNLEAMADSLSKMHWNTMNGDEMVIIEKIIETELENGEMHKEIRIINHSSDSNMVFYGDDDNVKVVHKGNMVFVTKGGDGEKNINVIVDDNGYKMMHINNNVVLTDISKEESANLKGLGVEMGRKELDLEYIKLLVNSNKSTIDLTFKPTKKGTLEVAVSNMKGQKIMEERLKNFEGEYKQSIQINNFGKGTYILQIIQGNSVMSKKIIIE